MKNILTPIAALFSRVRTHHAGDQVAALLPEAEEEYRNLTYALGIFSEAARRRQLLLACPECERTATIATGHDRAVCPYCGAESPL